MEGGILCRFRTRIATDLGEGHRRGCPDDDKEGWATTLWSRFISFTPRPWRSPLKRHGRFHALARYEAPRHFFIETPLRPFHNQHVGDRRFDQRAPNPAHPLQDIEQGASIAPGRP